MSFQPILVGMYDSPYVRRVAVTLNLSEIDYEHQPWSVFSDPDQVRRFNPIGRVPALQISADETLIDSSAIIDYLDSQVAEPSRLTPASGAARRQALRQGAIALATCDKAVAMIYERHKRRPETFDADWYARLSGQLLQGGQWLNDNVPALDGRPDQAQLTAAIVRRFVAENFADCTQLLALENLATLSQACEALPAFVSAPFSR